ncbi:MAG: thiol-disulfide oxidoreductase DCC family protein [Luteolibacter sp.]
MRLTLFYDADCGLCSALVERVARSSRGRVHCLPLQGEVAQKQGFSAQIAKDAGSMVVVRDSDGVVFTESEACLELARAMGGIWRCALILRIIPKSWRDRGYRMISRHRRMLWRGSSSCAVENQVEKLTRP